MKHEKFSERVSIHQKQKKYGQPKNPYNINISFNINNPKKAISNQINKTVQVNHYSIPLDHQAQSKKSDSTHKQNISSYCNYSTSFSRSKNLNKNQCLKNFPKHEDTLQNSQYSTKKQKKSKSKPLNIETKPKAEVMENHLSLNLPVIDPLPQTAVKKINKMKKYFLQKIGSMDITIPKNSQQSFDLIKRKQKFKNSELMRLEQTDSMHISPKNHQDQQNLVTQRFSEYQVENLVSYENEERKTHSGLQSKDLFECNVTETFPQIFMNNLNSMSIPNQYLKHNSKFLNQNISYFQNEPYSKGPKRFLKSGHGQFDLSHVQVKSKLLNPFEQSCVRKKTQKKKEAKPKMLILHHKNSAKGLKQKIKIVQQFLLKNDSSASVFEDLQIKEKTTLRIDTNEKVQNIYKKDVRREYIIKTDVELQKDLMIEIKEYEQKQLKQNRQKNKMNRGEGQNTLNRISKIDQKQTYVQFLNNRENQFDKKQTFELISNYIVLLKGSLQQENPPFTQLIENADAPANFQQFIIYQDSQGQPSDPESLNKEKLIEDYHSQDSINSKDLSKVSSYLYGESQNGGSVDLLGYSLERNQKIMLQTTMRNELIKRVTQQLQSTLPPSSQSQTTTAKTKPNSNVLSHPIQQIIHPNFLLNVSQSQQQYQKNGLSQVKLEQQIDLNQQMDGVLGFIKQSIDQNSPTKQTLQQLYKRLIKLSNIEANFFHQKQKVQNIVNNQSNLLILKTNKHEESPNILKLKQAPQKFQKVIKKINHKRSFSHQKQQSKIASQMSLSDDINIWDLILVEQSLNKKYHQITIEKEKQLFQIETDSTLTILQCQEKIEKLEKWEAEQKQQVLYTKREIKNGIQNLRKILTPINKNFQFKMKSLSQKQLCPNLMFQQMKLPNSSTKKIQTQDKVNPAGRQAVQTVKCKNKISLTVEASKIIVPKLTVDLGKIFFIQPGDSNHRQGQAQVILENEQLLSAIDQNQMNFIKRDKIKIITSNLKQNNIKQTHQIVSSNTAIKIQTEGASSSIDLTQTDTNQKKNLFQSHEQTAQLQSQELSEGQTYDQKQIYQYQESNEKQQFIDLLKIQKYKLSGFDQAQDEAEAFIDTQLKVKHSEFAVLDSPIKSYQQFCQFNRFSDQDKIDICQFILLDLCIELYQETIDQQDAQIRLGVSENSQSHRIIKSIFSFIKKSKKISKKKTPKIGIHTELPTVKDYLQKIQQHILSIETSPIQSKVLSPKTDEKSAHLIAKINSPIGPTAFQILKTMRFFDDQPFQNVQQQYSHELAQSQGLNSLILPASVFTQFEEKLQNEKQFAFNAYFEDKQKQKNRLLFLKNVTHIHHKATFDALNQMLDYERPFGIWGMPFPWKKKYSSIKAMDFQGLKVCLKNSCSKVMECAMYMCGLLVDKQQSLVKDTSISEAYIDQVKEDRVSKMIINDFLENQHRFYFLDDEETEVLIETSYMLWVLLLKQALQQFQTLYSRVL